MPDAAPTPAEAFSNLRTAMEQFARAYLDVMGPTLRALGEMAARVQAAERDRDRPAWQSPYGPAHRRR
ncbi:hypothetical protein AB0D09_02815 [Streptomyces sp. NPDC049097]|uniref:hypothetical protein n=1 Tax=Streptomyces sp. NPDC049097 TaxID=3155497 RepID=UPI00343FED41